VSAYRLVVFDTQDLEESSTIGVSDISAKGGSMLIVFMRMTQNCVSHEVLSFTEGTPIEASGSRVGLQVE
jgi:hypothetical protein